MQTELKFFADESVERRIVVALRERWEVVFVDEIMKGADDKSVLQNAETLKAVLVTADKDFGALVYQGQKIHSGIVFYRLHGLPIEEKISLLSAAIDQYGVELLHSFTVVTPQTVRIRKL